MFHWTKAIIQNGPRIVCGSLTWMRNYARHPEKTELQVRYNKLSSMIKSICKSFNTDFIVEGLEDLPKDSVYCLTPNHLDAFDPLPFFCVIDKPTSFIAKKEVEKMPFVRFCVKDVEGLFIDRKDLKQSLKIMVQVQNDLSKSKNKNWLIFPEGTRNKDPLSPLKEFHHGTFRAPMRAKVPIVPVAIYGTFRTLKVKPQFKRYPLFIKFLKPIYPEEYDGLSTQEVASIVQTRIQQAITYELRQKDHEFMVKNNSGCKYQFNFIY